MSVDPNQRDLLPRVAIIQVSKNRRQGWTGTGLKEIGSKLQVKEKWGKLTDDELDQMNGRRERLEGKIQERYGIVKNQAKKVVDAWYKSIKW